MPLIVQFFTAPDDGNHAEISTGLTNSRRNIMGHKAQMNIKHVGSIAYIRREIDEYMRGQVTSHHTPAHDPKRFDPSRTSNPDVAAQWEQRVAAVHAKVRIARRTPRKTLPSAFDPAPLASYDRVGFVLGLTRGVPAYEIIRHPSGAVTVWYHPEGTADRFSTYAHADAHRAANDAKVIPSLKREAFAHYSAMEAC